MLQFISNQETVDLLNHWSVTRPHIQKLAKFAVVLSADFPQLPRPEASPQIHRQFPGCVPYNFLAAMLSVRRPPGLSVRDLYKLACMRCWVLLKAMDMYVHYAPRLDQSVQEISNFVRMAFDDKGDQSKRQWILDLTEPADNLSQYEILLAAGVEKANSQTAGADSCKRAIRSLLKDAHKSLNLPRFESDGSDLPHAVFNEFKGDAVHPAEPDSFFSAVGSDRNRKPFKTSETATPPEIGRESKAIAFQSMEDHQFLPYSWNRPNPQELEALWQTLTQQLGQGENLERLLAAISIVALICHRSLETVSTVRLGAISTDFWQLDPDTLVLHKAPTRRQNNWQPDGKSMPWVGEHTNRWDLKLLGPLAQVLGENLRRTANPIRLTDLWNQASTETLETSFNQWCKKHASLKRLSSGLLPRASEQTAFTDSLDHVFADMLTRPSNSGITGAGSYASFNMAKVAKTLTTIASEHAIAEVGIDPSTNGLGSTLNPIDSLLVAAISKAKGKILNPVYKKEPPWVHQHNLLTGYMVTMLLAATGARPVTSIFETSAHFNLEDGHVHIEDKVSPLSRPGRSGRIVPLPQRAVELLEDVYFPHLQHLAQTLPSTLGEFSAELKSQIDGVGSTKLPLFFFLRSLPDFAWLQVSETTLSNSNLFDWPLPWNLFRHRLAIKLRELGLDAELIDAQLGHIEAGSETYGDYSVRCWADDRQVWRNALDTAFDALNPQITEQPHFPIEGIRLPASYSPFTDEGVFGSAAREANRKKLKEEVKTRTRAEITSFIGNRPIDSIAPADWEKLGTQMLLQDGNIPQPNALIRYDTYEKFLQDTWRSTGLRPRIKSWISRKPKPHTAFSAQAVHARSRLDIVRVALSNIFETSYVSDISRSTCGALAAIDLALTSHICDWKILNSVLQGDSEHLALIYKGGNALIEHSDVLASVNNRPVSRFIVPSRSVPLLTRVLGSGKKLPEANLQGKELSQLLQCPALAHQVIDSTKKLIETIADLVNQENSLEVPGLVAGVLAGRVSTFSLDRNDWYRATSNQSWLPPATKTETLATTNEQAEEADGHIDEEDSEEVDSHVFSHSPSRGISEKIDDARDEARKLLKEIRASLNTYLKSRQSSISTEDLNAPSSPGRRKRSTNHTRVENFDREAARRSIRKLLRTSDPKVSTAIYALARWILHLLSRPFGKRLLDVTSIQTYMDALTYGFISFGCAVDIADVDADELTEFYRQVIDPSAYPDLNIDKDVASPKAVNGRKNQIYVLQRLKEFHEYVAPIYGVELPDWSEIGEGLSGATASPGFITEREYLHALSLICPSPNESCAEKVVDAFILLLTYRFGLRGSEAVGLMKEEWVDVKGAIVVLIARRLHKLKTSASQRQIPLMEVLTAFEESIVRRWIKYWEAETKANNRIPLFFEDEAQMNPRSIRGIRTRLIQVLRAVTCNQHINLHHARHSYANRCALYLLSNQRVDIWEASVCASAEVRRNASNQLLATEKVTRRSIWATSRLLGHAGPVTTAGSYIHFLQDYCNALSKGKQPHLYGPLKRITADACNLDAWVPNESYLSTIPLQEPLTKVLSTPSLAIRYCELRADGMTASAVADHLNLEPSSAARLEKGIGEAGQQLRGNSGFNDSTISTLVDAHELLSKIERHRWRKILNHVKNVDGIYDGEMPLLKGMTGRSRQILLWDPEHVDIALKFLKSCGWPLDFVQFYRPNKIDRKLEEQAAANNMALRSLVSEDGKKIFQVDKATIEIGGKKIANLPSRIAMVRSNLNTKVDTNFELIVVWLAVTLS